MKKAFKIIGISLILLFLSRGFIYRQTIHYTPIETKPFILLTNKKLLTKVDTLINNQPLDLNQIADIASAITNNHLQFTFQKTSSNPNKIAITQKANCVGYAAFFNAIAQHIIHKKGLQNRYQAKHLVGKLDFLDVDLHQFFTNPFYQNHDYNIIEDKRTGKTILIDPSLDDYFRIGVQSFP